MQMIFKTGLIAEVCGLHPVTISKMCKEGKLNTVKRSGADKYLVPLDAVREAFGEGIADSCEARQKFYDEKKRFHSAFKAGCKFFDAVLNARYSEENALLHRAVAKFKKLGIYLDEVNMIDTLADMYQIYHYKVKSKTVHQDILNYILETQSSTVDQTTTPTA